MVVQIFASLPAFGMNSSLHCSCTEKHLDSCIVIDELVLLGDNIWFLLQHKYSHEKHAHKTPIDLHSAIGEDCCRSVSFLIWSMFRYDYCLRLHMHAKSFEVSSPKIASPTSVVTKA